MAALVLLPCAVILTAALVAWVHSYFAYDEVSYHSARGTYALTSNWGLIVINARRKAFGGDELLRGGWTAVSDRDVVARHRWAPFPRQSFRERVGLLPWSISPRGGYAIIYVPHWLVTVCTSAPLAAFHLLRLRRRRVLGRRGFSLETPAAIGLSDR